MLGIILATIPNILNITIMKTEERIMSAIYNFLFGPKDSQDVKQLKIMYSLQCVTRTNKH